MEFHWKNSKRWVLGCLLWIAGIAFGQDSLNYSWDQTFFLPMKESSSWTIDRLENYYVSQDGSITKYDRSGGLKFSQSIKSLGAMKQMVAVNTMKLVHFSEEQQTLCYFDNTLTQTDDCLDLADRDIINAIHISGSNQPDKVWVLDNINSALVLLSFEGRDQGQEIKNLRGVLDLDEISQIKECGNRLLLLDPSKGVYIFDLYGSLLDTKQVKNARCVDATENSLFVLHENQMDIFSLESDQKVTIQLPVKDVFEFTYLNESFFLRTKEGVHKFAFQILN